ncbi:uncharacterized protein VTP21DRAFT_2203 [Calcarisporiella thermophila]|uniref:uncharacterized protein n=1 Tax=Calcarisporiella thermophila TaxID=911321 RepID=UPI0037431314
MSTSTETKVNGHDPVQNARALISEKDQLEANIRELETELRGHGVGMTQSLVDLSGFPRTDIDVVAVRNLRHQIIRLRNDHKELMNRIENALYEVHAQNREQQHSASFSSHPAEDVHPFALVDSVAPDSPASQAGLMRGDKIVRFGELHEGNHRGLQALPGVVTRNEGKAIMVTLERASERITIELVPRQGWGGRGLLGCHIIPL